MYSLCFKLYTNYTQNPTLRVKETKSWGVNGQWSMVNGQRSMVNGQRSMVNGQRSTVNGQWSTVKETKRGREERRKDRLFETFYPPIFKPITWLSNCLTFTKREREAPLSWYTPRIFSWVIYFQCKSTKISFISPNKPSFISLILYFLIKISSVDFYLKNIKREGGLLKQEIYLWKSLFGKWFPH